MDTLERLQALYQSYQAEFIRLEQARGPGDGLFGVGSGPRNYPCHSQFAQELEAFLQDAADRRPDSAQVRQMLDFIYRAPVDRPVEDAVYWMLLAVHSLTGGLIPLLDAGDARDLWEEYQRLYPRRIRMEAQKKVLSALKVRAQTPQVGKNS